MTPKYHNDDDNDETIPNNNEDTPLLLPCDTTRLIQKKKPKEEETILRKIQKEVSAQMDTALPTLQSMVLTKIPWLISLRFVGGMGAEELAAAALATTLCNITGLSFSVGLSSALSTLAGQAKGDLHSRIHEKQRRRRRRVSFDLAATTGGDDENDNHHHERAIVDESSTFSPQEDNQEPLTPLVFLYRGLFIQLALVVPIGIWWIWGIKDILLALGQSELLASMTEVRSEPGIIAYESK